MIRGAGKKALEASRFKKILRLQQARGRLNLLALVFLMAYVGVAVRALDQTVMRGGGTALAAYDGLAHREDDAQLRADITDRNGVLLARSLRTASLYADPAQIADPAAAAKALHAVFTDESAASWQKKLDSKGRFVWLRRHLDPAQQRAVLEAGLPGVYFREDSRRLYPQKHLAAHILGSTNIDGKGIAGLEAGMNGRLSEDGAQPLRTTIDLRLQYALRREVAAAARKFSAKGGAGLIMNPNTGEVLAAVSWPDFDPNAYGEAADQKTFNRFSLGVYEPGSTFKLFSTAAYLSESNGSLGSTFDAREPLEVGRFKIRDYHAEKRVLTLPEVFMFSSNIGSALMGQRVGTERFRAFLDRLNLTRPLETELAENGAPLLPEPWREVNTLTAAFGHGIAVTPLQLITAASMLTNGGYEVKPHFVIDPGAAPKARRTRVVSEEVADDMRRLLRLVVTDGTGSKAQLAGYAIGGKTGTAEKSGAKGYDRNRLISSFLGVFPADRPDYAILVMIDEPQGIKETYGFATGGWVAAPAVANIVTAISAIEGVAPATDAVDIAEPLKRYIKPEKKPASAAEKHLAAN